MYVTAILEKRVVVKVPEICRLKHRWCGPVCNVTSNLPNYEKHFEC